MPELVFRSPKGKVDLVRSGNGYRVFKDDIEVGRVRKVGGQWHARHQWNGRRGVFPTRKEAVALVIAERVVYDEADRERAIYAAHAKANAEFPDDSQKRLDRFRELLDAVGVGYVPPRCCCACHDA